MNPELEKSLKKAKRKNTLRIILITLVTLIIALPTIVIVGDQLATRNYRKLEADLSLRNQVAEPNINTDSRVISDSTIIGGQVVVNRSKNISGYVVPWDTLTAKYSIIGFGIDHNELLSSPYYSEKNFYTYNRQTKQKVANFYHPEIDYSNYLEKMPNDLKLMDEKKAEVAEVALSFDQGLTWPEIQKNIPVGVTVSWLYMVSETSNKKLNGPEGDEVFGFSFPKADQQENFESFLENLNIFSQHHYLTEEFQTYLKKHKDSQFSETPILGITVTGENKDLKKLAEMPHLRAASVGVTAEITPYIQVVK